MLEEWVDEAGNAKVDKNGKYTNYATTQDKKFGDALKNSGAEGEKQFNALTTSSTKITVNFHNTGDENSLYEGLMTPKEVGLSKEGKETLKSANIDIYLGTIEGHNKEVKSKSTEKFNQDHSAMSDKALDNFKIIKDNNMSPFQQAVSVFGHEIGHTEKNNFKMRRDIQTGKFKQTENINPEVVPDNIMSKILTEMLNKN